MAIVPNRLLVLLKAPLNFLASWICTSLLLVLFVFFPTAIKVHHQPTHHSDPTQN
ncbi:hypothetical protein FIBSPDRAFT_307696 [Athelia psychrophila]|uniref:Uncharacterized protein n=1 Tax=Athelia psychrophila TaxID=1759441 RepID=A0A166W7G1_9AGAM|nr:hypothetical protein FIBSPDRAFT_307696 [Fibularhizoctonia sp. CBS 109695]